MLDVSQRHGGLPLQVLQLKGYMQQFQIEGTALLFVHEVLPLPLPPLPLSSLSHSLPKGVLHA